MIKFENVSAGFENNIIFKNLNYEFNKKNNIIFGTSGNGKTTLINLITGLKKPDKGQIIKPDGTRFSMVFQENRLIEYLSCIKNIKMVCSLSDEEIRKEIKYLLSATDDEIATSPVKNLSGGMKRRIALIRAMCHESDVVILDEPFTGLDEKNREKSIQYIIDKIGDRQLFLITHNLSDAEYFEDCEAVNINTLINGEEDEYKRIP